MITENATAASKAAQYKRAHQSFVLEWRSTGPETIVGYTEVCARLGLTVQSIRSYLSTGRAAQGWKLPNPLTGEPDVVTLAKLPPPRAPSFAKPKPLRVGPERRGRPRGSTTKASGI